MQFKTLEDAQAALDSNLVEFRELEKIVNNQGSKIQSIRDKLTKAAEEGNKNMVAIQTKAQKSMDAIKQSLQIQETKAIKDAKKYEAKITNNTILMQKNIMERHELAGAIKQLGGEVPEESKVVFPDLLPEEEELLQEFTDVGGTGDLEEVTSGYLQVEGQENITEGVLTTTLN